ncbi:ABC transporter permease [Pseudofrankia inefficax]|uniref:Binding-protein-dependent transport systems inner membrane component n=1 Tax=Pseudofrankia inefficax (strain DSM 45817 / CECT 9037 / DDB 130130 / EuI1c) TaxID=298654 RepID=E3IV49_PSEI1|nr:ABC transporter permease [Pseudofrankia inefficax]ADP80069.1 binding-protein-dependent transport systems inner membrane component [Pseudofrankia inefficax]
MTRYIVGRVLQAIVVLWAAFTLTFAILYLLPSDPMQLQLGAAGIEEDSLTPAQLAAEKHKFGLDQSIWAQYWHHLSGAVHGDFGQSIAQGVPVTHILGQRIGQTLLLSVAAAVVSLVVGAALAYVATFVRWNPLRVFLSRLPALGASFPQFFVALLLIDFFSFQLGWFPATGTQGVGSLVMPVVTISVLTSSVLAQVLIKSFEETLRQPYIVTARAKGLSRSAVHLKHAFRNAALPAVTILGVLVGLTVTSSIVVESVFTREGVGRLAQESVLSQDVPVVLAVVTVAAAMFVFVNLVVDLLYPLLDPRIARSGGRKVTAPSTPVVEVSGL